MHSRLIKVEGAGVRDSDTARVNSFTALETEGDPILLPNTSLIEWKIDLINWACMLRRENLDLCHHLLIPLFSSSWHLIDVPLGIHHVIEIADLVELYRLDRCKLRVGVVAVLC